MLHDNHRLHTMNDFQSILRSMHRRYDIYHTRWVSRDILFISISKTGTRVMKNLLGCNETHIMPSYTTATIPYLELPRRFAHLERRYYGVRVTMVRPPIQRLMSEYAFATTKGNTTRCTMHDLSVFAASPYRKNWQVAVLAGKRWFMRPTPNFLEADEEDLAFLQKMISSGILVAGVFERYYESIVHIATRLRLPVPSQDHVNALYHSNLKYHPSPCTGRVPVMSPHALDERLILYAKTHLSRP